MKNKPKHVDVFRLKSKLLMPAVVLKKFLYKKKALALSAFLVFAQLASPLGIVIAYASPTVSNSVGSSAALDPVANKASRLQMQGSSGVDQSTGAFTYSYPLAIPEGRGGMSPKLTLSYNSQNNDSGWFGYGWNISIPYIERTTKTGTDKLYTNPAFVSSLHGELVTSNGSIFEQKIDDGSYARYSFTGTVWQMTDRDGTTYYFGNTNESRAQDDSGVKIGRWYITEVRDKFGNGIVYSYTKHLGTVYPASVSYTEHALAHPLNLVTFGLVDKADKLVSYKYGFKTTDVKRVSHVKISTNGRDNTYFTFNYTTGSNGNRSLLESVEERRMGTNGDWSAIPRTTFEYQKSDVSFSGTVSPSVNPLGSYTAIDVDNNGVLDLYAAGDGYYPIDINGDYKKDLLQSDIAYGAYSSGRNVNFKYNQGSSTFFLRTHNRPTLSAYIRSFPTGQIVPPVRYQAEGAATISIESVIVDINGDGFDDVVYNNTYGPKGVAINTTNNTFDYSQQSNLWFDVSSDFLADVNGDGLTDKLVRTHTATSTLITAHLNNTASYSTSTEFVYDAKIATQTGFDIGVRLVDVNNDGLADILRSYTSSYVGSGAPACTTPYLPIPGTAPINQSVSEVFVNDGTKFIPASTSFSGYLVSYSACAEGFTSGYLVTKTSKEYDVDGDMDVDYDGATNNTAKQDILKKVETSLGSTLEVSYQWTTATGINPDLPVPMFVVGTTTEKLTALDSAPNITSYSFMDGKMYFDEASPRDHRFSGFGKVQVLQGNNKAVSYFHQGDGDDYISGEKGDSYYNIGRVYRTDTYDLSSGTSTLVSKNLSLYTTYSYASSSFTYLDSQVANVYNIDGSYLSSGSKSVYDETKRLTKALYNYGDIEPFASFASSTITDKGTDLTSTQYQYSNIRPQRLTKEIRTDFSGKIISSNSYYYDGLPLGLVDKGAVTAVTSTIYNPDGSVNATTTMQNVYDPTGNITQTIDGLSNSTRVTYDESYVLPVRKIDALNGTTTFAYDRFTLSLLSSKGPDGITHVKESDGFGRVTRAYILTSGGGITDEVLSSYVYGGGLAIYTRRLGSMGVSAKTLQVYDSYGRLIQSKKEITPNSFLTQNITYDAQSNIVSTSLPYTTNGYGLTTDVPANGSIIYSYDGLGRVVAKTTFGTTHSYQYGARSLIINDNADTEHKKAYLYDANNNLSQVKEYNGASIYVTSYNYTPQNKLSSITDANGNIRNFSYFSNGLLKYQEDIHAPTDTTYTTYSYVYDVLGNLLSKTGPLGALLYSYDALNRPTARVMSDGLHGTSTVTFTYTGCDNNYSAPCLINRETSSTTLTYMPNGKLSSETLSVDGKAFEKSYTYDIYGNIDTITYPDEGKATYTYTLDGKQSTLTYTTPTGAAKNVITGSSFNSLGSLSSMTFGNGVQMCNTYTTSSSEGVISPRLSKSAYLFNSAGCSLSGANQIELYTDEITYKDALTPSTILTTYKDIAGVSHTKNDTLTYDNLARLTEVSTSYDGGSSAVDTLVYDPIGNILKQNDILFRYSIDGTQNAHAVTSIGGTHISYDAQGNRTQVGDSVYTWSALNQMLTASSTNGSEIYTYDEQGERIKKVVRGSVVVPQKSTPTTSSSSLSGFTYGDILALTATSSTYIATSTYNALDSVSLLDKPSLTTLVGDFYGSPFTSKYCASAASSAVRQSCIASTTKQLIAHNLNSRSTTTIATIGLVDDVIKVITGALLIPSTYTGLATSSIAASDPSTFTVDSGTIDSYNTFVATGVIVPMAEYASLPYISTSTYETLSSVGLTNTSKVRALLTLSGCISIISSCATAKKIVFEKYYKENGHLLSDRALEEMWYVFAAKARLPENSAESIATSTRLGSISVPVISGMAASAATSTYYSNSYFTTEYNDQNTSEPRLQYFNSIPYYVTQSTFNELQQVGITKSTLESYESFISDLLGTKVASSTEYMFALKVFAQHEKGVTLSQNALKELYLVVIGAATIPNDIYDYTVGAVFDLAPYLTVQTVYGPYGSPLSSTASGCHGGPYGTGYGRCTIRTSTFTLPVATSSTVTYLLSVTAPSPTDFILNAGESSDSRRGTDNYNYGVDIPLVYSSRYSPATSVGGMLDYVSGTTSTNGWTQTIDVTSTVEKQKASSTEPAVILLMNRSGWSNGEQYVYQASSTVLKAYVTTPRLTLASTTLISGVTNATTSLFTSTIASVVASYFGEVHDSSSDISGVATSTLTFVSPESYAEFASTTLLNVYSLSKIFLSTSTPQCISNASTTECDKQVRKTWFREIIGNLSGFTPSQAATEEFWMAHKGILLIPYSISSATDLYTSSPHRIFIDGATTTVAVLSRLSLPQTLATSTATTSISFSLVPPGILNDVQYRAHYSTSTFALATSTKIVSEDTYNELLRTPIRIVSDVDTVFNYTLPSATSSCSGQSATSSCVVSAMKTSVKSVVGSLSGHLFSDAALEELHRVYIGQLTILPISITNALATTTVQTVVLPITTGEAFITFSTSTVGTSTVFIENKGECSFGTSGATSSVCYVDLPHINSGVTSVALSYDISTSTVSTSSVSSLLTSIVQTNVASTSASSTPTFTTEMSTSTVIGQKVNSTKFSFDITALYQNYLGKTSARLSLTPTANGTSTSIYSISNPTLSITRSITVPRINYREFGMDVSSTTVSTTTVATTSLQAYYKLDEFSGNGTDSSGNSLTLSPSDTPAYTTGKVNNGRSYSGGRDGFNHTTAMASGTASVWFKYTSINANFGRLLSKTQSGVTDVLNIGLDTNNKVVVYINDGGNFNTNATTLSTNTWYHYVVTWDGSRVKTYKNGALETDYTSTKTVQSNSRPYFIGGTDINSQGTNGVVDEVGLWSRTLSSTEVASLYNQGQGLQHPFETTGYTSSSTALYTGATIDPTYPGLPPSPQQILPPYSYPFIGTSTVSTTTLFNISSSTTTEQVVYTPFTGYSHNTTSGLISTYLTLNGVLVGVYSYQEGDEAATGKMSYLLTSYLGTPTLATDDKGDIVEMDITDVFGNYVHRDQRVDNALHTKSYTGHEYDDTTSLLYAKARYLTTAAHTFLSVDPMLYKLPQSYLMDPQQMNSYAYARNNPVVYTDPTGEAIFLPAMAVMGIAALIAPWVAIIYEGSKPNADVGKMQTYANIGYSLQGILGSTAISKGNGGVYSGFASPSSGTVKTNPGSVKGIANSSNVSVRDSIVSGRSEQAALGFPMVKAGSSGGPGAQKPFGVATKEATYAETQGRCVFCGNQTTTAPGPLKTNFDHAISRKNYGNNTLENSQTTCRTCNLDKRAKNSDEYMEVLFRRSENAFDDI